MIAAQSSPLASPPAPSPWQRFAAWLVRRRVRITLVIVVAMIVEDVLVGIVPRDIFDWRDPKSVAGCALIFLGLAVRSWSAGILRKTRELTTTGPYAIMRNPLYVGTFMIMCGFCLLIDDPENLFIVLGPLAGLYALQVLHEERVLNERYQLRWVEYRQRVPRLLPRRWPREPLAGWELSQWLGSREYRALGACLLGMLAVQLWRLHALSG
jgi:protein-S-isoprenylcysteine O-methyltransferase Ste14